MTTENPESSSQEQRLHEILAVYLEAHQAGQAPDRQELLARHPDLAGELAAFLAAPDQLHRMVEPLRAAAGPVSNRAAAEDGQTGAYSPTLASGASTPAAGPPLGTRVRYIGDYELLEELGRGGMGVVYLAQQT